MRPQWKGRAMKETSQAKAAPRKTEGESHDRPGAALREAETKRLAAQMREFEASVRRFEEEVARESERCAAAKRTQAKKLEALVREFEAYVRHFEEEVVREAARLMKADRNEKAWARSASEPELSSAAGPGRRKRQRSTKP